MEIFQETIETLWEGLLELTSELLIPDWALLISLIPFALLGLIGFFLLWTVHRFANAGPTRRRPARITPVTPSHVHMPGPSLAPVLAAFGTFMLFLGLIVGGIWLLVGVVAIVATLLFWGREGIRDYDHIAHPETLPAVVHPGPPPGVHMPGPSFRPFEVALAASVLFAGLIFGGPLMIVGLLFLVATMLGWLVDARKEYVKVEEADQSGHLENLPDPRPQYTLLGVFGFLVIGALVGGWLLALSILFAIVMALVALVSRLRDPGPQQAHGAAGEEHGRPDARPPAWWRTLVTAFSVFVVAALALNMGLLGPVDAGAEPEPTGPATPAPEPDFTIISRNIAFDIFELTVPAGEPFAILHRNEDDRGVLHDIDIRTEDGEVLVNTTPIDGGEDMVYAYPALDPGTYVFICSIHPIPAMTGTLTVE
jgi:plastocyanin